jgi:hypothetical protein
MSEHKPRYTYIYIRLDSRLVAESMKEAEKKMLLPIMPAIEIPQAFYDAFSDEEEWEV